MMLLHWKFVYAVLISLLLLAGSYVGTTYGLLSRVELAKRRILLPIQLCSMVSVN